MFCMLAQIVAAEDFGIFWGFFAFKGCKDWGLWTEDWGPGPDGYPRVLAYSILKSLLVPYSKNFTTRSSSWVVAISFFLSNYSNIQKMEMWNFCDLLVISSLTKFYNYNNVHLPVSYCQFNLKSKTMSMKSNNLASKLPQQLHVALDDKQLLPLFRVQGDFEHLCQYM